MLSEPYKRYVLWTLTVVYASSFLDRGLIVLLLEPIKKDLQLSDTQLGFLTGIAFGLFYATLGLPIARWADRGNRVTIASLAIALWGVTVMSCVFVTNFVQLVFARIAAAIGESGCMPPTYSLLGDIFPGANERARAMTIYMLANPLSALISYSIGGWLGETYGWRTAFLVMGVPGLLFAVLFKASIIEPRAQRTYSADEAFQPQMIDVVGTALRSPALRHLITAMIISAIVAMGLGPWYASFLIRSHNMTPAELGIWFGLITCFGGAVGILGGGYVTTRLFGSDERGQVRIGAAALAAAVPCFLVFLLAPHKHIALAGFTGLVVVGTFYYGPTFALLQRLVVAEMRATMLALTLLLTNVIGMGIGPQAVGILSDQLMPIWGRESLRYAMLAMSLVTFWASYHLWRSGRTLRFELATVEQARNKEINSTASDASRSVLNIANRGSENATD
jgi:MFS family permease